MKNRVHSAEKKQRVFRRSVNMIVIVLNVLILSSAFMFYVLYTNAYEERLHEENLVNVANLNRSAASNAVSLFDGWGTKLGDIAQFVQTRDLSHAEALEAISDTNSDKNRYLELIGSDYKGFVAKKYADGTYPELDYTNVSYAPLQRIFDNAKVSALGEMNFAPEYTDGGETAEKFFAMYKYIALKNETGEREMYTLLLAMRSKDVLAVVNSHSDYRGQSTVLTDAVGNYIVGSKDFKSSNFFRFLYVNNGLTLDQKNDIQREVETKGHGELYYNNAGVVVENCVFRYERMSGNGWYCITCVPTSSFHAPAFNINYIIYAAIMLLLLLAMDICWLQGMNRRLRLSMLREKQASAAKGNFMSRMSHEIRTPLNAVIGYNTIALSEISNAKDEKARIQVAMKVADCLNKSEIASKHLLAIINDVLDMAAIESGKIQVSREQFDFKSLITSLTTVFYAQAKSKGVNFDVVFDTLTEEWFIGDQMRTNQILTNLLSNAVKFTPNGGNVTLKITQPEVQANTSHIHFQVSDTGIGMPPGYLKNIWVPFEQADSSISRRFGGTGLGLAITKNLVDLMGGTIDVISSSGAGTVFSVDLVFERTKQPKDDDIYSFDMVNALVVDDDPSTCDYIRLLFDRCGASSVAVTSGEAAVRAFSEAQDKGKPYTMCLVDRCMPNMDGIETIKRIRSIARDNNIPMVVITAYDYTEIADNIAELGVTQFISKPLFQSSLFDLLANICGVQEKKKAVEKEDEFDFSDVRVLLAEDNVMNMEIAKNVMESVGIVVDGAWNGKEAVDMFLNSAPGTYRVILMDVHMPEMNGHDATRAIRAAVHSDSKTIPIIAMTADAFAENVAEAYDAGMNAHIAKPIDLKTLFSTLKKFL